MMQYQANVPHKCFAPRNTFLIYPDLSENEIGALAARELREYMRSKDCRLRSLAMRKADIDDDECRQALHVAVERASCRRRVLDLYTALVLAPRHIFVILRQSGMFV